MTGTPEGAVDEAASDKISAGVLDRLARRISLRPGCVGATHAGMPLPAKSVRRITVTYRHTKKQLILSTAFWRFDNNTLAPAGGEAAARAERVTMSKFRASMFGALRAAERVVVDGLLVRTFQLEGSEGGAGILNLEDGSAISFANQELTIINGYSAFRTEAEAPHSVDFIMPGNRGLREDDIQAWSQTRAQTQAAVDATRLQPAFRLR